MVEVEGKFLRIYKGLPYVARVTVQVQFDLSGPRLVMDSQAKRAMHRGILKKLPQRVITGYKDWKQGAEAGIRHALRLAEQEQYCVRVTRVVGMTSDTNPTIIGVAAMQAVWQAIDYTPLPAEIARIESIVFGSWQQADDFVPDFGTQSVD